MIGYSQPRTPETVTCRVEAGSFAYCFMVRRGRLRMETDFPVTVSGKWGPRNMHGTVGRGGVTDRGR